MQKVAGLVSTAANSEPVPFFPYDRTYGNLQAHTCGRLKEHQRHSEEVAAVNTERQEKHGKFWLEACEG